MARLVIVVPTSTIVTTTSTSSTSTSTSSTVSTTTTSTSTLSSSTSTTFKLKHQGTFSEHHPTTSTTSTTLAKIYDFFVTCQNDTDCGLAEDCCGCILRGHYFPMNKQYVKSWESSNHCPINVHCFGSRKPCENYHAICVNKTCDAILL
jgi:hypothetical protein